MKQSPAAARLHIARGVVMVSRNSPELIMSSELATSDDALHRGFIPSELVDRLFLEWNVSKQCVTGAGGHYIPDFAAGPDGAFYANELGFGRHNAERDVVQTSRELYKNEDRRDKAVGVDNELVRKALARSPNSLVLKAKLKRIETPRGCTGCASCAPSARIAPEPTIRLDGSFADWRKPYTPGSPLTSEQISVVALLQTATKTVRRALREQHAV